MGERNDLIQKELPAAPWWAFALHWPIASGREIVWGSWTAVAVPLMKLLGISETLIASAMSVSAIMSMVLVIIFAYVSDRCRSRFGRRRPFIFGIGMMIVVCMILLYISTVETMSLIVRQVCLFSVLVLVDSLMNQVEVPLMSYTIEMFRQKDRQRIITGFPFFGGVGNIIGLLMTTYMAKQEAFALCLLTAFITFMLNTQSRKEIPLDKVDNPPVLQPMAQTLKSYIVMPANLRWLAIYDTTFWCSMVGLWGWFTHVYAESVGGAIPDTPGYNETYDAATTEAARVMIGFPISAMVLGGCFTYFNLLNRISLKLLMQFYNVTLIGVYIMLKTWPTKGLFYFLSILLGLSSIIIQSAVYILVNRYRSREDYPSTRGLANDTSIFTLAGALGQFTGSTIISIGISLLGGPLNATIAVGIFCCCVNLATCQFFLHYE